MSFISGVPQRNAGVWAGATDFSEFAVAAGIPAGITQIPPTTTAPINEAIANDAQEGNYYTYTPQAFEALAHIFDAFSSLAPDPFDDDSIEFLARIWMPTNNNNRRNHGPAYQVAGTSQLDLDYAGGGVYFRTSTDYESTCIISTAGAAGVVVQSDWQEAEANSVWVWQRVRIQRDSPTAYDWFIKTWTGDLADEPASFDGQALASASRPDTLGANNAIGWAVTALTRNGVEQRVAFLSFTTDPDPDTNPPPTPADLLSPGDIFPPTVTIQELQGTYVIAAGSAFEVVP